MPRRRGRPARAGGEAAGGEVQSLDRAVHLLEIIAHADGIALSEMARRAELPASTVHRLLATLERRGLVAHEPESGAWTVGVGSFRIGSAYLRIRKLPDIGRPVIRRLMRETNETVNLSMMNGEELVCVAQAEAHAPIRAFFRTGSRLPVHASAAGKAILAASPPEARRDRVADLALEGLTPRTLRTARALISDLEASAARGWCLDDEEHTLGMRSVAAAIFNEWDEPIGAVSVSAPAVRIPDVRVAVLGESAMRAAQEMTRLYSGRQ